MVGVSVDDQGGATPSRRLRHGKGFSRSNLIRIRQVYQLYPIGVTMSHQLSWYWN